MKKLLIIVGIIVVILLVVVLFLPSKAHVERSIFIQASPAVVYNYINNIKKFNDWSAWAEIDAEVEYTYEGPSRGVGAKMSWKSEHQDIGVGSQWIDEVNKNELIATKLVFEGFENPASAQFHLSEEDGGTRVLWDFDADMGGLYKVFVPFMDISLGPYYEKGLENLKNNIESLPTYGIQIMEEQAGPVYYVGMRSELTDGSSDEIQQVMEDTYSALLGYLGENNIQMMGMPFCIYELLPDDNIAIIPSIAVGQGTQVDEDNIIYGEIPVSTVIKGIHFGDYRLLEASHDEINKYIADQGLSLAGNIWENYINDPGAVDTANWETHIYYPIE